MHRVIMGFPSLLVDHIDCNGLNNQRDNLRTASTAQNTHNRRKGKNNTTGYKGVQLDKRTGQFRALIRHDGANVFLGHFCTAENAAIAYAEAAKLIRAEFARTA